MSDVKEEANDAVGWRGNHNSPSSLNIVMSRGDQKLQVKSDAIARDVLEATIHAGESR